MKTTLQELFKAKTQEAPWLLHQVDSDGSTWYISPILMLRVVGDDKPTKLKAAKGKIPKGFKLSNAYPENLFISSVTLTKKQATTIIKNHLALTQERIIIAETLDGTVKSDSIEAKTTFDNNLHACLVDLSEAKFDEAKLWCSKNKMPILELSTDTETLRVALAKTEKPRENKFKLKDRTISLVDWSDETKKYNNIKEELMFEPPALPTTKKAKAKTVVDDIPMLEGLEDVTTSLAEDVADNLLKAAGITTATAVEKVLEEAHIKVEPKTKKEAVVQPVKKEEPTKEKAVEEVSIEAAPVNEEPSKEVPEVKAEEPVTEAVDKVADKRSRTPRQRKKLQDMSNFIEALRTDPPEQMSVEDMLNEVRQLRELIKMASCRMANVVNLFADETKDKIKKADEAQRKLGEISCLLSLKK